MSYRLWVLVAGLLSYTGCLVWFQDPTVKMLSSLFCAFIIGIGIVLVGDKFEHLEKEVAELQEQVAQAENLKKESEKTSDLDETMTNKEAIALLKMMNRNASFWQCIAIDKAVEALNVDDAEKKDLIH